MGELEEDNGGDLDFLLPPRVVVGPDENGLKKVIEYRFDDEGNKVKVVTTTRTCSLARARLSRSAVERRSWAKFGDAVKGDDAGSRLTMVSTEEVLLERPRARGSSSSVLTVSPPMRFFRPKICSALIDLSVNHKRVFLLLVLWTCFVYTNYSLIEHQNCHLPGKNSLSKCSKWNQCS